MFLILFWTLHFEHLEKYFISAMDYVCGISTHALERSIQCDVYKIVIYSYSIVNSGLYTLFRYVFSKTTSSHLFLFLHVIWYTSWSMKIKLIYGYNLNDLFSVTEFTGTPESNFKQLWKGSFGCKEKPSKNIHVRNINWS